MATTFLELTNELLRELNEIVLTSSTFSAAVGIQAHAKDCINRAYLDIVNEEPKWPFLAVGESGATDPMYGNVAVSTTAATRWYELKTASSSIVNDYGAIDWNNFYITTVGVSGETAPYVSRNLSFITTEYQIKYIKFGFLLTTYLRNLTLMAMQLFFLMCIKLLYYLKLDITHINLKIILKWQFLL